MPTCDRIGSCDTTFYTFTIFWHTSLTCLGRYLHHGLMFMVQSCSQSILLKFLHIGYRLQQCNIFFVEQTNNNTSQITVGTTSTPSKSQGGHRDTWFNGSMTAQILPFYMHGISVLESSNIKYKGFKNQTLTTYDVTATVSKAYCLKVYSNGQLSKTCEDQIDSLIK